MILVINKNFMITPRNIQNAYTTLGLDGLETSEVEALTNTIGYDVVANAMSEFIATLGEWELTSFESWIEAHQHEPDMFEQLMLLYPHFGQMVTEGILKLKNSSQEIITPQ